MTETTTGAAGTAMTMTGAAAATGIGMTTAAHGIVIGTMIGAGTVGVTATVMTDASGSRLVLKGATGQNQSFTLTKEAADTADADLQRFTFNGTSGGRAMNMKTSFKGDWAKADCGKVRPYRLRTQ